MKKKFVVALMVCLTFTPLTLFAQIDTSEKIQEEYMDITRVNFTEVEINGVIQAPSGALVYGNFKPKFKAMIKHRVNFNPEVYESVDNL